MHICIYIYSYIYIYLNIFALNTQYNKLPSLTFLNGLFEMYIIGYDITLCAILIICFVSLPEKSRLSRIKFWIILVSENCPSVNAYALAFWRKHRSKLSFFTYAWFVLCVTRMMLKFLCRLLNKKFLILVWLDEFKFSEQSSNIIILCTKVELSLNNASQSGIP